MTTEAKAKSDSKGSGASTLSDTERMANLGIPITLKKCGDVRVRELVLEDLLALGRELTTVLEAVDFASASEATDGSAGFEFLGKLLENPATAKAVKVVAAATCEKDPTDFDKMSLVDCMKWLRAFKEVTDWEEIQELFFQIVPANSLSELAGAMKQRRMQSQDSSTSSQPPTGGRKSKR